MTDLTGIDLSGLPDGERAQFEALLANPGVQFGMLPLEEQKELTHAAAVDAARRFVEDPGAYRDRDGAPDPMRAFYELGHLSATRDMPTFALLVIGSRVLDEETERDLAVFAWRAPEWPEQGDGVLWRATWRRLGFCSDLEGEQPPTSPLALYRGAVPRYKRGMSWTADLDKARWFARRFPPSNYFGQGRVYAATVPPERVFARIADRGEDEWVIDTRGLAIKTLEARP